MKQSEMQMITQKYETLNLLKWEILMNILKKKANQDICGKYTLKVIT